MSTKKPVHYIPMETKGLHEIAEVLNAYSNGISAFNQIDLPNEDDIKGKKRLILSFIDFLDSLEKQFVIYDNHN